MTSVPLAAFAGVIGACVGSYIATAAMRTAEGRQSFRGRSACDGCGVPLSYLRTVPIASFVLSGGRCHRCGGRIAKIHLLGEAGGALAFGAPFLIADPATAVIVAPMALALVGAVLVRATREAAR